MTNNEAEQGHAAKVQEHWVEAALDQLAGSGDADEFHRHWLHLAEHFDTLFTTPESVTRLDATLLQLAVRGKLVPPACRQAGKTLNDLPAPQAGRWFVYVLECADGSFYKGFTTDLQRRYAEHCAGKGANWTRQHHPKQLFYWEQCHSEQDALRREQYLKSSSGREWFQREVVGKPDAWEPASELLKKIRAEKDRLIAEGKIKRDKALPPISDDEKPYELPEGWEWVKLADMLPNFQNGASSRGDEGGIATIVLRLADIKDRRISLASTRTIPIKKGDIAKYKLANGDILIVRVNGSADIVGQFIPVETEEPAIYCDHFIRMRIGSGYCQTNYLCLLGQTSLVRDRISSLFITTAGQKTVNQGHISSLLIALPPLAEQSRIVAKVEELMALTASLKARLAAAQTKQSLLAEALVADALAC